MLALHLKTDEILSMSVTVVSRIMLNIQNPHPFENVTTMITENAHSCPRPSRSTSRRVCIEHLVECPAAPDFESSSQYTMTPDIPSNNGPKRSGENNRLWYELAAEWGGIRNNQNSRSVYDDMEVIGSEFLDVSKCKPNKFFCS